MTRFAFPKAKAVRQVSGPFCRELNHQTGCSDGQVRLTGEPGDEAEARRDSELLERWRRSQGMGRDVIAQRAEQARARILDMMPRHLR